MAIDLWRAHKGEDGICRHCLLELTNMRHVCLLTTHRGDLLATNTSDTVRIYINPLKWKTANCMCGELSNCWHAHYLQSRYLQVSAVNTVTELALLHIIEVVKIETSQCEKRVTCPIYALYTHLVLPCRSR